MKAKILEIFRSIQGEGAYVGVRQVFVRFYECNMFCHWCDTPYSIGPLAAKTLGNPKPRYKEYSKEELLIEIDQLWDQCHSISLTGGEPLMQVDFIKELLPELKSRNYPVHLETNGTLPDALEKIINDIDVVAMDMKLPSSTRASEFWNEHERFLKIATKQELFIKTVITDEVSREDVIKAATIVKNFNLNTLFILQPNSKELQNGIVKKCEEFERILSSHLKNVRIMPQMHKVLKVR